MLPSTVTGSSLNPVTLVERGKTLAVCFQQREYYGDFFLTVGASNDDARFTALCASNTCPVNIGEVAPWLFELHGSTPSAGVTPFLLSTELHLGFAEFLIEDCDFGP